jgi:hypothetical protein
MRSHRSASLKCNSGAVEPHMVQADITGHWYEHLGHTSGATSPGQNKNNAGKEDALWLQIQQMGGHGVQNTKIITTIMSVSITFLL